MNYVALAGLLFTHWIADSLTLWKSPSVQSDPRLWTAATYYSILTRMPPMLGYVYVAVAVLGGVTLLWSLGDLRAGNLMFDGGSVCESGSVTVLFAAEGHLVLYSSAVVMYVYSVLPSEWRPVGHLHAVHITSFVHRSFQKLHDPSNPIRECRGYDDCRTESTSIPSLPARADNGTRVLPSRLQRSAHRGSDPSSGTLVGRGEGCRRGRRGGGSGATSRRKSPRARCQASGDQREENIVGRVHGGSWVTIYVDLDGGKAVGSFPGTLHCATLTQPFLSTS